MGSKLSRIILLIACIVFVILLYRVVTWFLWGRLPEDDLCIALFGVEDTLSVPPRPGVQGIVITGPKIEDLTFEIDGRKAGLKRLDWQRLEAIDKGADVKIRAEVTDDGRLKFSRKEGDIKDEGHPDAGREIESIVRSWAYTPYKTGTIRLWFNVPSKGKKLVIDKRDLKRKSSIDPKKHVYDGLLYYISGIESGAVDRDGRVHF